MTDLREAAQMALRALQESKPIDINDPTAFYRSAHAIEALRAALAQPEQEPVGNTLTFMTRAIFNIVADHQEINGGYFIADGDVAAFVDRLAKIINSTFEPLKHKNTAPPQREVAQAMRLYKAVERLSLQAGEETDEAIDWLCGEHGGMFKLYEAYFSPKSPQRDEAPAKAVEWQGLTDEERKRLYKESRQPKGAVVRTTEQLFETTCRAIEAKLKEKNCAPDK